MENVINERLSIIKESLAAKNIKLHGFLKYNMKVLKHWSWVLLERNRHLFHVKSRRRRKKDKNVHNYPKIASPSKRNFHFVRVEQVSR